MKYKYRYIKNDDPSGKYMKNFLEFFFERVWVRKKRPHHGNR